MFNLETRRLRAARELIRHVADLLQGDLSVELWNGEILPLGPNAPSDVRVAVRSPNAIRRLLLKPGLSTIFELYAENELDAVGANPMVASRRFDHFKSVDLAKRFDRKLALRCALPFLLRAPGRQKLTDLAAKSAPTAGAGRDDGAFVRFHYDLSNAFYALFLDPAMVYSCGYFETRETSLEAAQEAKLDRVCQKLRLKAGERFLDLGCGWGGLLIHAATRYGAICHGVTLSKAQYDFASARIAEFGLADRVTLEMRDFRSIDEPEGYDKIAQIEMFEHLGIDNHDAYFQLIHKLLKPRGLYLHHSSTRWASRDLAQFRKPTRYQKVFTKLIFPGGELDYLGLTLSNLERRGFEVHDVENLRDHFQLTVEAWLERLDARLDDAKREIGDAKARLWLLYFAMTARAFERGVIGVFHTLASKRAVGASGLSLTRQS